MPRTQVRSGALGQHVPEDLRAFQERLADAGVEIDISVPGPAYALPEPVELDGTPLSELIRELRER